MHSNVGHDDELYPEYYCGMLSIWRAMSSESADVSHCEVWKQPIKDLYLSSRVKGPLRISDPLKFSTVTGAGRP